MPYIASESVARNIGRPFELCCVGVSSTNIARLKGFKLLLRTEFVGHGRLYGGRDTRLDLGGRV